jgi:hypothetical protein
LASTNGAVKVVAPVTVTGSGSDDQARRVDLVVKG